MKAIGDYTKQVYNLIQVHTEVAVDGPYGHLTSATGMHSGYGLQVVWASPHFLPIYTHSLIKN